MLKSKWSSSYAQGAPTLAIALPGKEETGAHVRFVVSDWETAGAAGLKDPQTSASNKALSAGHGHKFMTCGRGRYS